MVDDESDSKNSDVSGVCEDCGTLLAPNGETAVCPCCWVRSTLHFLDPTYADYFNSHVAAAAGFFSREFSVSSRQRAEFVQQQRALQKWFGRIISHRAAENLRHFLEMPVAGPIAPRFTAEYPHWLLTCPVGQFSLEMLGRGFLARYRESDWRSSGWDSGEHMELILLQFPTDERGTPALLVAHRIDSDLYEAYFWYDRVAEDRG